MATITINGVTTPLPIYHGGYENDHEWALQCWINRINNNTVYATIKKYGTITIENELKKLISYCMGCIIENNNTKFHNDMWNKLVSIMHEELADVFHEETK